MSQNLNETQLVTKSLTDLKDYLSQEHENKKVETLTAHITSFMYYPLHQN